MDSLNTQHSSSRFRAACVLVLMLIVGSWLGGGVQLLTRPFWMDELHSQILVDDPDALHALSALTDGVDYNPPTYFALARLWSVVFSANEVGLRSMSVVCAVLSAVVLFLILSRNVSFIPAMTAVVAVFGQTLMILQAAEARFYSLWVLLAVSFCFILTHSKITNSLRVCLLAVLTMLICSVHYFGILSVVAMTLSWFLFNHRSGRCWVTCGVIAFAVAVTLACCFPLLTSQKAALSRPTWVSSPTITSTVEFVGDFASWKSLLACVVFGGLFHLANRRSTVSSTQLSVWNFARETAPVCGLLTVPVMIIGISWTIQPALVNRYAITGLIGLTPVFAFSLSRCPRIIQFIALTAFLYLLIANVRHGEQSWTHRMQGESDLQRLLDEIQPDVPVIFEDRISFIPAVYSNDFPVNWYLADFSESQLVEDSNLRIVQRDVGRQISKWYPDYQMRSVDSLKAESEFIVVPYHSSDLREGMKYPTGYNRSIIEDRIIRMSRSR